MYATHHASTMGNEELSQAWVPKSYLLAVPSPRAPEPTFSFNIQVTCLVLPFHLQLERQALPYPTCSVPENFAVIFLSVQGIISNEFLINTLIGLPLQLPPILHVTSLCRHPSPCSPQRSTDIRLLV